jgi:hypothetical protein
MCLDAFLRQRQFLGHFGAGPKEDLVRCLPTERWMRRLRVVLVDVEFDHERAGRLRSPFIRANANQRASIRFGPRKNTKPTIAEKTPGGRGPDERSALALQTPQG